MTFALDVNPLVYASDEASPFRDRARQLFKVVNTGQEIVYLFWPVAMGYIRIVTHPRVFKMPLSLDNARANIEELLAIPTIRVGAEATDFLARFQRVCEGQSVRGKLVPDAHLVTLMNQYGIDTVCTHDRDFTRFSGVKVYDPFSPSPPNQARQSI
jgi:toxin-antitoxin system PIN domain toxin